MNNGCLAIKVIATATTLQKRLLLCHSVVAHVFLHSHQRVTTRFPTILSMRMRCIHRYEMWFAIRTKDRGQAAETKWLRADVGNIGLSIGR